MLRPNLRSRSNILSKKGRRRGDFTRVSSKSGATARPLLQVSYFLRVVGNEIYTHCFPMRKRLGFVDYFLPKLRAPLEYWCPGFLLEILQQTWMCCTLNFLLRSSVETAGGASACTSIPDAHWQIARPPNKPTVAVIVFRFPGERLNEVRLRGLADTFRQ